MKLYIKYLEKFHSETIDFYRKHFEIVDSKSKADVIVVNDFKKITANKIVACNTTGIDHIKSPKIISLRGEDLNELTAVPELCLGMAIYTMRIFKNQEVKEKTLGIIGYGRIGKQFANYAKCIGMKSVHYDENDKRTNLDYVLKNSDIVSLHITADTRNKGFFNKKKFEKMKNGSILLNSARHWIVDSGCLKWALNNKLAGAWFDFELPFEHPKLITTSHLGGTTLESKKKSEMIIAKKLWQLKNS